MAQKLLRNLCIVLILSAVSLLLASTHVNQAQKSSEGTITARSQEDFNETAAEPTTPVDDLSTQRGVKTGRDNSIGWKEIIGLPAMLLALAGLWKITAPVLAAGRQKRRYKNVLKDELGCIQILGCPGIERLPVTLLDTFVDLRVSVGRSLELVFEASDETRPHEVEGLLSPDEVIARAFKNHRMLLIIGDPGSGKTTLVKYYAMCCLTAGLYAKLGFAKRPLPLYLPLGTMDIAGKDPDKLPNHLSQWVKTIPSTTFESWLKRDCLVLLDGLDEVSDVGDRRRTCEWIDKTARWYDRAQFVVTSRGTGYRKADGIELSFDHLRADVQDFSPEQQADFLQKWFRMVFLGGEHGKRRGHSESEANRKKASEHGQALADLLAAPENLSLRQLTAVPLLLQLIAILWQQLQLKTLPWTRAKVYDIALPYLLEYRDLKRGLNPLIPAKEALQVLRPVCLWMQEGLRSDSVDRSQLHSRMQRAIDKVNIRSVVGKANGPTGKITGEAFCKNLRDRAGLLADCGRDEYIFRHKSFREYLAGLELVDRAREDRNRLTKLVDCFYSAREWWREPLRFFIANLDSRLFERFMNAFFSAEPAKELDLDGSLLVQTMTREAAQIGTKAFSGHLENDRLCDSKKRCILACLKIIGSNEAINTVRDFSNRETRAELAAHARQIVSEVSVEAEGMPEKAPEVLTAFKEFPRSFRNAYELNAEYILIPGGQYKYHVTDRTEPVSDMYFAKYPITNKRYRRFIRYITGQEPELQQVLPSKQFCDLLRAFASEIEGFADYLGSDKNEVPNKLRSDRDEDRRFGGDDQPVVGVSWFDARAYCFWLSMLSRASAESSASKAVGVYRLPTEMEWEWAAAGREHGGTLREYPWPAEKGSPTEKLANYGQNVGATTPVGSYPEGATPEGLMDMAGNVWEWMENWHEDYVGKARSLRGGSWLILVNGLRCSARGFSVPDDRGDFIGFRVVCSQS